MAPIAARVDSEQHARPAALGRCHGWGHGHRRRDGIVRPLATRLCEGGHVLVSGSPAKPSTRVRAGDRVEALIADRKRVVEVVWPIESRVRAAVAATCYVDHSPPVVPEVRPAMMLVRGEGRPSKRLRRKLERLLAVPERGRGGLSVRSRR